MTNIFNVCLFSLLCFSYSCVASARQLPKECSKGPSYWCQSLKIASDCGAVGHCIGTVWEKQEQEIRRNDVSEKFIRLFRQLKDVKDLINAEYLSARMNTACRDVSDPAITKYCRENTAYLEEYLAALLSSNTSPETMCRVVAMCNSDKLDHIMSMNKKKSTTIDKYEGKLLGSSRCTWGPSYWCSNFSTGRECKATHHCVSRVWPRVDFPQDNDGICKICTDMVKQARDQLQSNETQEELKEVFEGSCKLIPIKIVRKECIALADDFVPELVETLASQMNPQAVCSVAGLCNNARIDALLEDYNKKLELRSGCNNCRRTVGVVRKRFDATTYEDFLVGLLQVCGRMSSLSDSCSMLTFKYYENILAAIKKDLTPHSICHLSGQCAMRYHSHDDYDFPDTKLENLKATDDVPCEFCEQVVNHLRDVLVANTTESEFHRVLIGLCKQTGSFKSECLSIVEQYYSVIYNFLVSELKGDEICTLMGICSKKADVPVAVLLPKELAVKAITQSPKLIGTDEANSYTTPKVARVPVANKQTNVRIISESSAQLPIERMFVSVPQSKAACSFCQYFLHYLQVELSDTNTEESIQEAVSKACNSLPQSVNSECKQFVTEYGPAVIALLVQEIDPSSVCPALGLCPQTEEVRHVSINSDKSNCPLCLFAVEQLETMLKNNRSEDNIRHALDNLCNHLSAKLRTECVDFVDSYTKQLVEMLVANMNAQEICVFLKLCKDEVKDPLKITHQSIDKFHEQPQLRGDRNNFRRKSMLPQEMLETTAGDIETNEIPDHTVNGRMKKQLKQKSVCIMCEFVMKEIDDQIKDKHNDDEIKKIVHGVCKRMPKSVRSECDQFVDKYSDLVISLLAQELDPSEVCQELKLCDSTRMTDVKAEAILDCAVCETVVMAVKKVLSNDKVDRNIVHVVEKSCALLPAKYSDRDIFSSLESLDESKSTGIQSTVAEKEDISEFEITTEPNISTCQSFQIEGRRIVDFNYFYDQMKTLSDHNPGLGCTISNIQIIREKLIGLQSSIYFQCNMCNRKFKINLCENLPDDRMTINHAAVTGAMLIGCGRTNLNELFTAVDLPNLNQKTYNKCHSDVSSWWEVASKTSMKEAAKEECELATESGDIIDGIPAITVVADACWSKRSYGNNYAAASGSAAIIGFKTGKVLFMECHTMLEIYGDSVIHLIEELGTKGVCEKIGLCSDHSAAYVHMHTGNY